MSDPLSRRHFTQLLGAAAIGGALPEPASSQPIPPVPDAALPYGAPSAPPSAADDLTAMTAVELAARIRRKDVSAREVLEAHLARIDRVNPAVNAIVTLVPEKARA